MVATDRLLGSWSHAHEEDRDGLQIFRPSGSVLAPSRGRTTLTLLGDHTARWGGPGATDSGGRPVPGTWSVEGDGIRVESPDRTESFDVRDDCLVLTLGRTSSTAATQDPR